MIQYPKKTYIEKIGGEYDIKCGGMPTKCKRLFDISLRLDDYKDDELKEIEQQLNKRYKELNESALKLKIREINTMLK